jgi:hypothetical protein
MLCWVKCETGRVFWIERVFIRGERVFIRGERGFIRAERGLFEGEVAVDKCFMSEW